MPIIGWQHRSFFGDAVFDDGYEFSESAVAASALPAQSMMIL